MNETHELLSQLASEIGSANQHARLDVPLMRPLREVGRRDERHFVVDNDDLRVPGRPLIEIQMQRLICFWALSGRVPMRHSKSKPPGRAERLRLLETYEPDIGILLAKTLGATRRSEVQIDDVLDAAVAFITAEGRHGTIASLSGTPSHDPCGLAMEMLYLEQSHSEQ